MKNTTETQSPITWQKSGPLSFSGCRNGKEVFWTIREAYGFELFTALADADVVVEDWENCAGALFMLLCDTQEAAEAKAEEIFAQWLEAMGLELKHPHRCDTCQKWIDEVCP